MANITSTVLPSFSSLLRSSQNVLITNLPLTIANTEYSHALQNNLKILQLRNRDKNPIQLSFILGNSNITFLTIPPFCFYEVVDLDFIGKAIYVQSAANNQLLEIVEYY